MTLVRAFCISGSPTGPACRDLWDSLKERKGKYKEKKDSKKRWEEKSHINTGFDKASFPLKMTEKVCEPWKLYHFGSFIPSESSLKKICLCPLHKSKKVRGEKHFRFLGSYHIFLCSR